MPWIEVVEPHAKPPRLKPVGLPGRWSGRVLVEDGLVELTGVAVDRTQALDLAGATEVEIGQCTVVGQSLASDTAPSLECQDTVLEDCDLSRLTIRALRRSRLVGCKLTGTDLSTATVSDVVFERCQLQYTNLRMAKLKRVQFVDCVLHEVDGFELEATDLSFPGSTLQEFNLDRLVATRVDLRDAAELDLTGIGRLDGCLAAEVQLPTLAYAMAAAAGLNIEKPTSSE